MMRGFILGIIVTIVVIAGVGLLVAVTGHITMRADILPMAMEKSLAMRAMDANVERNAPKIADPIQPTEQNLVDGAEIYAFKCAMCHGDPVHPQSLLANSLYPPPPQFMYDTPDMAENENYYITLHGVRWTGMPGWKRALTTEQIWKVVTFLSHMDNLPPKAKAVFGLTGGTPAAAPSSAKAKPMKPMPKM
ncbi:MAG: c-type cytochrome [Candidatus Acidiferrales bacterium]